jgi:hypothetical protein
VLDPTLKRVHPRCRNDTESNPPPQPEIELCVPMSNSFNTTPDRRQSPRTKLVETAYIGMGPENGGLVLDVSDGGLSFHAVAPVQPAETVHFLLSMRGQTRIEGSGEVVWTNEMRTVCGLRFTSLSGGAREYLNAWTNQSRTPADAVESAFSPDPSETPQAEVAPPSLERQSDANAEPLFAIPPADQVYGSESEGRSLLQEPVFYWIMFGILAAAITVTAFNYGVHVGRTQISSASQPAANPGPQKESPLLPPAAIPPSPVASDAFVNESKTNDTTATTSQRPGAEVHGAVASDQRAEQALEAGKSELAAALAYLNVENGQRDSSKAVPQLWAAIGKGNSDAEVILAGLYVKGEGVAKNCQQARVLLIAAAKSGNAGAKLKLNELKTHGCP